MKSIHVHERGGRARSLTATKNGTAEAKALHLEATQRRFLESRFRKCYVKGWKALLRKLRSYGGEMMVPQAEQPEDVQRLLKHGQEFSPRRIVVKPTKGRHLFFDGECHGNTARFWAHFEGYDMVTGYALVDDCLWWQHSWLWSPLNKCVIETRFRCKKYFGAILYGDDALRFAMAHEPEYREFESTPLLLRERIRNLIVHAPLNHPLLKERRSDGGSQ
jgi:hypothetical protein